MIVTAATAAQVTQIAAAIGAGVVLIAFSALIAWPAWNSYGRNWERLSALFLSLYVLIAMVALGAGIGLAVFTVLGEQI